VIMKQWLFNIVMSCFVMTIAHGLAVAKENTNIKTNLSKLLNIDEIPRALSETELSRDKIPSPHWIDNACSVCHLKPLGKASIKNLRKKNINDTCLSCHDADYDHRYIHPIDIRPSKDMLKRMNTSYKESLKKTSGKISCVSCHDIALQCEGSKSRHKMTNSKFFRKGPFKTRSQPCYYCHDKEQYERLNPHEQINERGEIRAEKCRICHVDSLKVLRQAKNIDLLKFNASESLETMCWGCHKWIPHPGGQFTFFKQGSGPNHLVRPSELIKSRLDEMTKKNNIDFPLEPGTGRVFCGTCHNAHEKGVIKNKANAKGAGSKRRLRDQEICKFCHFK